MKKKSKAEAQTASSGRFHHFVQQERESGLHPAIRALHARAKGADTGGNGRAVQYTRIERGHMA